MCSRTSPALLGIARSVRTKPTDRQYSTGAPFAFAMRAEDQIQFACVSSLFESPESLNNDQVPLLTSKPLQRTCRSP